MAKAVQIFAGNDSYGRPEEYAQRADGRWFTRHYCFNGYGMGMCRWFSSPTQDLADLIDGDVMRYGFNPLRRTSPARLRLP